MVLQDGVTNNTREVQRSHADMVEMSEGAPAGWSVGTILLAAVFVSIMAFYLRVPGLREALFIVAVVYAFWITKHRLSRATLPLLAYIALSLIVGLHTYLLFGPQMATAGTIRFVAAALLAPLAAVLVKEDKEVRLLLFVWSGIIVIGAATAVYQYLGGDLTWALGPHMVRGGVLRIRTSLGEVNVGGMAAPALVIIAISIVRSGIVKIGLISVAAAHVAFSLSKAGVIGLGIALFVLGAMNRNVVRHPAALFRSALSALVVAGVGIALVVYFVGVDELSHRLRILDAVLAASDRGAPTFGGDVYQRTVTFAAQGTRMALEQGTMPVLNVLLGTSYGVAGSAAVELRFGRAVLPHNSFVEAFLVGGVLLVSVFLALLARVGYRYWVLRESGSEAKVLFACMIVLVAYMPAYPVIYQPVLGGLFWVIVGIAFSPWAESRLSAVRGCTSSENAIETSTLCGQ
jgi:hypothetical protein